jgi:hypothetical protein
MYILKRMLDVRLMMESLILGLGIWRHRLKWQRFRRKFRRTKWEMIEIFIFVYWPRLIRILSFLLNILQENKL